MAAHQRKSLTSKSPKSVFQEQDILQQKPTQKRQRMQLSQGAQIAQAAQAAQAAQMMQTDQIVEHREDKLYSLCKNASFNLADEAFNVKHIKAYDAADGIHVFYNDKPAGFEVGNVIAKGAFGEVRSAVLKTKEGIFNCAVKVKNPIREDLDEITAYLEYPLALTCEGIVNFFPLTDDVIIMPLATGSLFEFNGILNIDQACRIAIRVSRQLECLLSHGIVYYDVKPDNILYFCRGKGKIDISLADIGSIVPKKGTYTCTHSPPEFIRGRVPVGMPIDYTSRYYTYLLVNLIFSLLSGDYMSHFSKTVEEYVNKLRTSGVLFMNMLMMDYGYHPTSDYIQHIVFLIMKEGKLDNIPPFDVFTAELINKIDYA